MAGDLGGPGGPGCRAVGGAGVLGDLVRELRWWVRDLGG